MDVGFSGIRSYLLNGPKKNEQCFQLRRSPIGPHPIIKFDGVWRDCNGQMWNLNVGD